MKKLLVLLPSLLFLLICVSCQKENISSNNTAPIESLQNVTLKNGRLHFPSKKELSAAETALNQEEQIDLTNWYNNLNFKSQQELYFEVNEVFSTVNNEEDYRKFQSKYNEVIYIDPNKSLLVKGYYPFLAPVLNTQGELYVGNALIKYTNTHKITILDGEESKLAEAILTLKTNEDKGIIVDELNFQDLNINNNRSGGCSDHLVWHDCYYGSHERIWGRYEVIAGLPTLNLQYNTIYDYLPYQAIFNTYIKSEYKGFLDFWYLKRTQITWSIGWGVKSKNNSLPSYAHGTGWTVNNVSIITYQRVITDYMSPITMRQIDLDQKKHIFNYCYANLDTYNISCSQACN
jgi:hypothetical protein